MSSFLQELEHKDQCRYHRADPQMHQPRRRHENRGPNENRRIHGAPQRHTRQRGGLPEFKDQVQNAQAAEEHAPQSQPQNVLPEFKDQVQNARATEDQRSSKEAGRSLRDGPQIVTVEAVQVFSEAHVQAIESGNVQAMEQAVIDGDGASKEQDSSWWKSLIFSFEGEEGIKLPVNHHISYFHNSHGCFRPL